MEPETRNQPAPGRFDMPAEPRRLRFAVVNYETRRDLEDSMRFFRVLDVVHLYRRRPWQDLVDGDYRPPSHQFRDPLDLYLTLRRLNPDVVQALEPFSLRIFWSNLAVFRYAVAHGKPYVVPSLANVPMATQYGRPGGMAFNALVRPLLRRASLLLIYVNEGARQSFLAAGAPPERMVRLMYGCWGVDLDEFRPGPPDRPLRRRPAERVILFVGRLDPTKGVFDLLAAFRHLRASTSIPARLVYAGGGEGLRT